MVYLVQKMSCAVLLTAALLSTQAHAANDQAGTGASENERENCAFLEQVIVSRYSATLLCRVMAANDSANPPLSCRNGSEGWPVSHVIKFFEDLACNPSSLVSKMRRSSEIIGGYAAASQETEVNKGDER
ncbi:MAG: hypothetical protein JJ900_13220 [Rhodospirillales bacterium]|nr:hypothetical protein [Rhodospirillales bacterium]MBO6787806.1 hypothetical protein [Rhodospirillales bacterium]